MNLINFLAAGDVTCGSIVVPEQIASIVATIYTALRWGVPLILIIVGMFDMGKAITQQKEDEIKKAQNLLVKKAVAAILIFLMFSIVKLVVGLVDPDSKTDSTWTCIQGLLGIKNSDTGGTNNGGGTTNNGSCSSRKDANGVYVIGTNNCAGAFIIDAATGNCTCN